MCGGFCGTVQTLLMEIRDAEGGAIRFMAQQGRNLPDPTHDQLLALFGIDADSVPTCAYATQDSCSPVTRTPLVHVLLASPSQLIAPQTLTNVQAAHGSFDVLWTSSLEEFTGTATCTDNGPAGPPNGFIAARVSANDGAGGTAGTGAAGPGGVGGTASAGGGAGAGAAGAGGSAGAPAGGAAGN